MFMQIIQGQVYPVRVYSNNCILIIRDQYSIHTFNNVTKDDNDDLWLNILIDQDDFIAAGIYQFQLFENNILKESGSLQVIGSLLVDSDQQLRSKYQVIVDAIEKTLAGVASKAQKDISIGDKKITYYSASELLSLLDYFKGKLKEEEKGYDTVNNELKIKYQFKIR